LTPGRSTPNVGAIKAVLQAQEEELTNFRNGQVAVNHSISLLMELTTRMTNQLSQSQDNMMRHMTEQSDALRLHFDSRMASFAQAVDAPVQQAVNASTTAAGMASELAGRYVSLQDDLERTFNAATAA
jgi:DNA anti-recombination protein RmuC